MGMGYRLGCSSQMGEAACRTVPRPSGPLAFLATRPETQQGAAWLVYRGVGLHRRRTVVAQLALLRSSGSAAQAGLQLSLLQPGALSAAAVVVVVVVVAAAAAGVHIAQWQRGGKLDA